jgi:hydroxymethylbilane synthase
LRRRAQLKILNPNWEIAELRGNVDTRLRKLEEGFYEGIVLAAAGIKRLGLLEEWPNHEILSEKEFLPAPCQGALGLEIREQDKETAEILAPLNHEDSEKKVLAERAFMRGLQAGCQIPAGISSFIQAGQLTLVGALFSSDGKEAIRWSTHGDKNDPEAVGEHLADWLLNAGGKELLERVRNEKR